jgi:hypothetical protein
MCNFKRSQGRFWIFGVVFLLGSVANHGFADSETAEPVTQSENTTSISSGAIFSNGAEIPDSNGRQVGVGTSLDKKNDGLVKKENSNEKDQSIPVLRGIVFMRSGEFSISLKTEELKSFFGRPYQGDLRGAKKLSNSIFASADNIKRREEFVAGYYLLHNDTGGYLQRIDFILENVSNIDLELLQRIDTNPSIQIYSKSNSFNNGGMNFSEVWQEKFPERVRVSVKLPFPAHSRRVWSFDVKDLLVKKKELVVGSSDEITALIDFFAQIKNESQPIVIHFKMNESVQLRLPSKWDEFKEFNRKEFFERNFSELTDKVKAMPKPRRVEGIGK